MSNAGSDAGRREMSGAEMVVQALRDNGVEHIFGPANREYEWV